MMLCAEHRLVFSLNGQSMELQPHEFDPSMSLNEYLRDEAGLKATVRTFWAGIKGSR